MLSFRPAAEAGRGLLSQLTDSLRGAARSLGSGDSIQLSCWRASGAERSSGEPLSLVYAGNERHKNYFFKTAFRPGWTEESLGRNAPGEIPDALESAEVDHDAVVFEIGERAEASFRLRTHFRIPVWLELEIGLPEEMEGLNNRRSLANLRRYARKNPWSYEFSRDEKLLKTFYRDLYVPFSEKAHGESAYIYSFADVKTRLKEGELLLAMDGGVPAGGMILERDDAACRLSCLGVQPANEQLLKDGIISALYFKAMERCVGKGIRRMNLGYSKAFFRDGAFRFKSRIGARVLPAWHRPSGYLTLRVVRRSPGLENFFLANPFITLDAYGRPCASFFCREGARLNAAGLTELLKDSFCGGVEEINIFTLDDTEGPFPYGGEFSREARMSGFSGLIAKRQKVTV